MWLAYQIALHFFAVFGLLVFLSVIYVTYFAEEVEIKSLREDAVSTSRDMKQKIKMSKNDVALPTPRFVFRKSNAPEYMQLYYQNKLNVEWTLDKSQASQYNSKYSAKTHLSVLRQNHALPEGMMLEPL